MTTIHMEGDCFTDSYRYAARLDLPQGVGVFGCDRTELNVVPIRVGRAMSVGAGGSADREDDEQWEKCKRRNGAH